MKIMINIKRVFKLDNDLIFVTDDKHNFKVGDEISDQNNNKYKIIGIVFQTNDLFVKPLFNYKNEIVKTIN